MSKWGPVISKQFIAVYYALFCEEKVHTVLLSMPQKSRQVW